MAAPDPSFDRTLDAYAAELRETLGDTLVAVIVYGSALGDDFVAGRSDVNVLVVVRAVSRTLLDAMADPVARWRRRGFALPLIVDPDFLERARDTFPMELDDIRRAHRTLYGPDLAAELAVARADLRRQCEQEARAKLLRLRTLYLDAAAQPGDLERLLEASLTSFLVLLRHLVHLHGEEAPQGFAEVLSAGERFLGPLPALRRLFDQRRAGRRIARGDLHEEFGRYLTDVERIVTGIDTLHA